MFFLRSRQPQGSTLLYSSEASEGDKGQRYRGGDRKTLRVNPTGQPGQRAENASAGGRPRCAVRQEARVHRLGTGQEVVDHKADMGHEVHRDTGTVDVPAYRLIEDAAVQVPDELDLLFVKRCTGVREPAVRLL